MRIVLGVLLLGLAVHCRKHSDEDDKSDEQSAGEKIVDRLAINLAGAFVKSMFPEMDRPDKKAETPSANEVRRRPVTTNIMEPSMNSYSDMDNYAAMSQMRQMGDSPKNPFAYQQAMGYDDSNPNQRTETKSNLPMPDLSMLAAAGSGLLSGGDGNTENINAIKNRQYLHEMAKHQAELNAYAAKQMAYIENQKRYQQAMIDHQAGAALLMQQQQQESINQQMKKLKSAYGEGELPTNDNTGGSVLTARARGVRMRQPSPQKEFNDDDVSTSDEHLKTFFKQQYGIDFDSTNGSLTDEEKETLRALKKELMKNKDRAIEKGSFRTMKALKSRIAAHEKPASGERSRGSTTTSSEERPSTSSRRSKNKSCSVCKPIDFNMMEGAWTQIYGNPDKLMKSVNILKNLEAEGKSFSREKIACLGMELGSFNGKSSSLNYFFRDNNEGNKLHEMRGEFVESGNDVSVEIDQFHQKLCMVRYGPSESDRYEYVVLAETTGADACRSYHVFARNTDEFNRRHFDDVNEFMRNEVTRHGVLPVAALPKTSFCQLDHP